MTNYPPPAAAETMRPTKGRRRLFALVAAGACALALIIGIGVGAVVGTEVESTPEYRELSSELTTLQDQAADLETELSESASRVQTLESEKAELEGNLPEREEAVTNKERQLDRRDQKLRGREKKVTRRENSVSKVENRIAANTFSDGIYKIGVDIEPGTYRKDGDTVGCYYAILNDTTTGDIANNFLVDGPAVITLPEGKYFEANDCGEWVLQP